MRCIRSISNKEHRLVSYADDKTASDSDEKYYRIEET